MGFLYKNRWQLELLLRWINVLIALVMKVLQFNTSLCTWLHILSIKVVAKTKV
jgi:hypothetical protein